MSAGSANGDWRRTHTCGELTKEHVGQTVTLNGWVHTRRDHGSIYFVDLRDRYGLTQVVLGENVSDAVKLNAEDVISVRGEVVAREAANVNEERSTGEIEVAVEHLELLSKSETPPIEVAGPPPELAITGPNSYLWAAVITFLMLDVGYLLWSIGRPEKRIS